MRKPKYKKQYAQCHVTLKTWRGYNPKVKFMDTENMPWDIAKCWVV